MRTGTLASRSTELVRTQITLRRFLYRLFQLLIHDHMAAVIANLHHLNVVIGTTAGARPAPDARAFMNQHIAGLGITRDGPGRTPNHADGIGAMHARIGELQIPIPQTVSDETGIAVMRRFTRFDAIVAPRAAIQVQHHRLRPIHQTTFDQKLQ